MRILVVKLSSLGDVVQTLPVLHDIGRSLPGSKLDWVVEEAFTDLVRQAPTVGRVLPYAQRRWRKDPWASATRIERDAFHKALRAEQYDAVIDFQGLIKSARVARGARLARGGFSATFGNRSELCAYEWPVRYLLQRAVPMPARIHAVARYRLLAARALRYETAGLLEGAPVYPWAADPAAGPPEVLFAHGTTRADNEWAEANWAALGREFIASGFRVLLPQASAHEEEWALRMAQALGTAARVLPRMGLPDLLNLIGRCSSMVGVDSGVSHMGVALGLPLVQIFSQPRAWRAGPVGQPHQCAVGGEGPPSVQEVWRAWQACWGARPTALAHLNAA
ncbi:MAG: lipopolysaccharide heptosyltransferase I [Ramlibacter sp.]|nr:lipopolysaccharide heptosyltransferase I [Ramlibacter sp.]